MNVQELKTQLARQYPFRIELHAHTSPVSLCSQVTPEEMTRVYKELGYNGVVITNHLQYRKDESKESYIKRYWKDIGDSEQLGKAMGLKVYPGAEIRFTENDNDYLIFGVDRQMLEEIYDLLPYGVEDFRKHYAMPRSVFIQAHPMRNGMEPVDPALLDGIEVFNMHPNHNSRLGLAGAYARENPHFIVTAGSDFHHPGVNHEGLAAIRTEELPEDSFAIAKLLKNREYLLELGRECAFVL